VNDGKWGFTHQSKDKDMGIMVGVNTGICFDQYGTRLYISIVRIVKIGKSD